jgi:hypothetical protein
MPGVAGQRPPAFGAFGQPIFVARAKAFGRTNGAIWPKRYA